MPTQPHPTEPTTVRLCDNGDGRQARYRIKLWRTDETLHLCPACLAKKAAENPGDVEYIESLGV
jgi:hypothetical protein